VDQHKLVVLTRPIEGKDEEYNTWYEKQHLGDVLRIPGIIAAQRFRMEGAPAAGTPWQYLAVYEIEHTNPDAVIRDLMSRAETSEMPMSQALSPDIYAVVYTPMSAPRKA
jgi:hypothetical protein